MPNATQKPRVETYNLQTSTGRHIRKATKVVFADGQEIAFTERMSTTQALRQVEALAEFGRLARSC